uniref:Uncharacterized protein n=1 Tax=Davidia involucrata TaxID=16924 RepID=A0A5B7BE62_DAVIN
MHSPTDLHFAAVKRILRYLKDTPSLSLQYKPSSLHLQAYTDADWAGDPLDRRSTTDFLLCLGSNPINWGAKKQYSVARSTTEAEYKAMVVTASELALLKSLLCDLHIFLPKVPTLACVNISALALASNPVFHARTKHIKIDYHYVREQVTHRQLAIQYLSATDKVADIFTKSLSSPMFLFMRSKLRLVTPPFSLQGLLIVTVSLL